MKYIDQYKVEYLDYKLFTNSWGVINHIEKSIQIEALINEKYGEGFKLKEVIAMSDPMGFQHMTFIFEKIEIE